MENYAIDNSDQGDIERSITWQFDNAEHLVGIIKLFKTFYDESTQDYFDNLLTKFDLTAEITDESSKDIDYGLAVWGKILNVRRPFVTVGTTKRQITSDFYRRILLAKLRLLSKEPTIPNYISYVNEMFEEGNVTVIDTKDMALKFAASATSSLTDEEKAAISQVPDVIFSYPSGVKNNEHSDSLMLGLSDDGTTAQDDFCGGFDESSFCWRYTPKGNWS